MSENLPHRTTAAATMQAADWDGNLPGRLQSAFPGTGFAFKTYLGQNFIELPPADVPAVLAFLKEGEGFDMMTDLTAVDRSNEPGRFEVIYMLYSFRGNGRVRLKTRVSVGEPVPTAVGVYLGANWLEREVFDMFGIPFTGHPNLKRILMPDEWSGHPLRKDKSITAMDNEWVRNNLDIESGQ